MFFRKYKYNYKSCSYELETVSFTRIFAIFTSSLATLGAIFFAFFPHIKSLMSEFSDRELIKKNEYLKSQYEKANREIETIHSALVELQEQDTLIYRTIFQADPIKNQTQSQVAHKESHTYSDSVVQSTFEKLNSLKKVLENQAKSYAELITLAQKRSKHLSSMPAIQPICNKNLKRIGDVFGMRQCHPVHKIPMMHRGVDYVAPIGTKVYATGDGVVKTAKYISGFGNLIEIDHGHGVVTRYAHLNNFNAIDVGDKVCRGQCIGFVGTTGTVTGPHLHYEILKSDRHVDPMTYLFGELNAADYEKVIEIASNRTKERL